MYQHDLIINDAMRSAALRVAVTYDVHQRTIQNPVAMASTLEFAAQNYRDQWDQLMSLAHAANPRKFHTGMSAAEKQAIGLTLNKLVGDTAREAPEIAHIPAFDKYEPARSKIERRDAASHGATRSQ